MKFKPKDIAIAKYFIISKSLTKGKKYEVLATEGPLIWIKNDNNDLSSYLESYFDNVPIYKDTPEHYDNTNGSLYKIAQQRGWNAYQFDIVKRIDRCEKKGEFIKDLEKTKFLIDLYKDERGDNF